MVRHEVLKVRLQKEAKKLGIDDMLMDELVSELNRLAGMLIELHRENKKVL